MSHAASPFTKKTYGVVRVTRAWELARSSFYYQRAAARPASPPTPGVPTAPAWAKTSLQETPSATL